MSLYKELNEVNQDLNSYERTPLSAFEKRNWKRRVIKKIRKRSTSDVRNKAVVAAAIVGLAVCMTVFSSGVVTIANIPLVGNYFEQYYLNEGHAEPSEIQSYKTMVGLTTENDYGRWTLNEVWIDGGRLMMTSTFEPAEGVRFNYRMHPMPSLHVNGKKFPSEQYTTGGQTIKLNESSFMVYNEVESYAWTEIANGEPINLQIVYDHLDLNISIVDSPWSFDVNVPTDSYYSSSKSIVFNKEIPLSDGSVIRLHQLIATPISTVVYYDWPESANHVGFKIVSNSGDEINADSMSIDGQYSYNRFPPLDWEADSYTLIPYETSENIHADEPGILPNVEIPLRLE